MKKSSKTLASTSAVLLMVLLMLPLLSAQAAAAIVRADEARVIAERWVQSVVASRGAWGGAAGPVVGEAVELEYGERIVGYYFPVEPRGFVAVSLRREFAPVKAYSVNSRLDPLADGGPSDLLRGQMGRVIEAAERLAGPIDSVEPEVLVSHLEIDYRAAWNTLERSTVRLPSLERSGRGGDYIEGDTLVAASWGQTPPYNADCPDSGCFYSPSPGYNTNALVGCVATAGAQIMHHWSWPPYGSGSPYNDPYDWPNVFEDCYYSTLDQCFKDVHDTTYTCLTQAQIDAVAELNAEIGQAVDMDYGCDLSSAFTADMEGVYENQYRYATACNYIHRGDNTATEWFNAIKAQCYGNRPMQYRVLGHSFVCDGWQEPGGLRQYHMNYGWDDAYNAWYTLDALYYPFGGSLSDEALMRSIYPAPALGGAFTGTFTLPSLPYRYFDRDCVGNSATFSAGHNLQFLPGVVVGCQTGYVTFNGSAAQVTRMFARGDRTKGAKISGGAIKILNGGNITIP